MEIHEYLIRRESEITPLSEDEYFRICDFRRRVESYLETLKRYQVLAIAQHAISDDIEFKKATFKANTPDIDHIRTLSMKFRFFYLEREPAKFESIISLLRKKAKDEWACSYLDSLRKQYHALMDQNIVSNSMGYPVSNREIINLWFNSDFFHSDFDKREKLININQSISEKASIFQLYTAITCVCTQLRSVYAIVHKISSDTNIICTPNHDFRRKSSIK